jgi:hypothetical protein
MTIADHIAHAHALLGKAMTRIPPIADELSVRAGKRDTQQDVASLRGYSQPEEDKALAKFAADIEKAEPSNWIMCPPIGPDDEPVMMHKTTLKTRPLTRDELEVYDRATYQPVGNEVRD